MPRKTSVKIAGVAAEIQSQHPPNTDTERWRYGILVDTGFADEQENWNFILQMIYTVAC
jgi:hypothetical protein